jgi:DNA-binding SARP family transcriptional activator
MMGQYRFGSSRARIDAGERFSGSAWLRGLDALVSRGRFAASQLGTSERERPDKTFFPKLAIYMLGPHRVLVEAESVPDWPNCRGKSIFNYLVAHRERPVPKDVLMDVFWPGIDPDSARNNLNASMYGLRRTLRSIDASSTFIIYEAGCYNLNPQLSIWVDAEALLQSVQSAAEFERADNADGAQAEWEVALDLYQDEYLADDRYGTWMLEMRRRCEIAFLQACARASLRYLERGEFHACMHACLRTLDVDACNEQAHLLLMRCYDRLGQPHLAIRQFHACRDALRQECGLQPSVDAIGAFERLRRRQAI